MEPPPHIPLDTFREYPGSRDAPQGIGFPCRDAPPENGPRLLRPGGTQGDHRRLCPGGGYRPERGQHATVAFRHRGRRGRQAAHT